jgi:hypothetical protein
MKKFLLLFLALISFVVNVNAQKIYADKQNEDGSRIVTTTNVPFALRDNIFDVFRKKDKRPDFFDLSTTCFIDQNGKKLYSLDFFVSNSRNKICMDKGSRLLLKLNNDSIIELRSNKNVNDYDNKIDIIGGKTTYSVSFSYDISNSIINILKRNKVVKMRMETDYDYFDLDSSYYNSFFSFSKSFLKCINLIDKELQKSNDLYDNF